MAESSQIEWTDSTWNPLTGCTMVSAGCWNCYAARLAGGRMRFPTCDLAGSYYVRVGRKAAGRLLDGRTHEELPASL